MWKYCSGCALPEGGETPSAVKKALLWIQNTTGWCGEQQKVSGAIACAAFFAESSLVLYLRFSKSLNWDCLF